MTKDQIVQILQLKTAWKWDPKETPDATVCKVCAEHRPEQAEEEIQPTDMLADKEAIEAKPIGYQGPGDPVWEYYGFDPETPGGEPKDGDMMRSGERENQRESVCQGVTQIRSSKMVL